MNKKKNKKLSKVCYLDQYHIEKLLISWNKKHKKTSNIYKIGPDVSFSSYTKTMSHFWNRCVNFCWTETKRSEKMIWVDKGLLECISTCYTTTTTNRQNEFFPALLTTYINHYLYIFFYFNIHQYIHKTAHIKTPNNQSNPFVPSTC